MRPELKSFQRCAQIIFSFVLVLWLIKIVENYFNISMISYGLYPGPLSGLLGILTSPLIHSDIGHLSSNSLPLIFLGTGLFYFYPKSSLKVSIVLWMLPGILTWILGRPSYHVGASGIIYGLVTFIFFSGVIRKDKRSITLSLLVTFLYGGIIWGVLPIKDGVSWEYHLFGAISGFLMAIIMRKNDPYEGYDWEEEEHEDDEPIEKLEIDWTKDPPF